MADAYTLGRHRLSESDTTTQSLPHQTTRQIWEDIISDAAFGRPTWLRLTTSPELLTSTRHDSYAYNRLFFISILTWSRLMGEAHLFVLALAT